MAELLVRLREKSKPEGKEPGMVIAVVEDGHEWGKEERPPKFLVIKVPDVPAKAFAYLTEPQPSDFVRSALDRPRRWKVDLPTLLANAKGAESKGVVTIADAGDIPWDRAKASVIDLKTSETEARSLDELHRQALIADLDVDVS